MANNKKNIKPQVSAPVERPTPGSNIINAQPAGGLEVYGGVEGSLPILV